MMYFKAMLFDDIKIVRDILATSDARKQKALERKVSGFAETVWDEHKFDIVRCVNLAKFDQNKGLRRKFFQTGDKILVAATPLGPV